MPVHRRARLFRFHPMESSTAHGAHPAGAGTAKRELFRVPFVGWHLTIAGYIEVERNNRERSGEREA